MHHGRTGSPSGSALGENKSVTCVRVHNHRFGYLSGAATDRQKPAMSSSHARATAEWGGASRAQGISEARISHAGGTRGYSVAGSCRSGLSANVIQETLLVTANYFPSAPL